eukprot:TRINITY_DN11287_c0_g1_i1.p1 TRINITY_DN11287_c0_g1~~TRINITY_DN11287_c0_g1_i1.p1  ORF type:complete len:818 (+),score=194.67 TRINITY_DN11287_c0_g1_i1:112-2454(+)
MAVAAPLVQRPFSPPLSAALRALQPGAPAAAAVATASQEEPAAQSAPGTAPEPPPAAVVSALAQAAEPCGVRWEATAGAARRVGECLVENCCAAACREPQFVEGVRDDPADGLAPALCLSQPLPLGRLSVVELDAELCRREGCTDSAPSWARAGVAAMSVENPGGLSAVAFLDSARLLLAGAPVGDSMGLGSTATVSAREAWRELRADAGAAGAPDSAADFPSSVAPGWLPHPSGGDGAPRTPEGRTWGSGPALDEAVERWMKNEFKIGQAPPGGWLAGQWVEVWRDELYADRCMAALGRAPRDGDFRAEHSERGGCGSLRFVHAPSGETLLRLDGKDGVPAEDFRAGRVELSRLGGSAHAVFQCSRIDPSRPRPTRTRRRKLPVHRRWLGLRGQVVSVEGADVELRFPCGSQAHIPAAMLVGPVAPPPRLTFVVDATACTDPGDTATVTASLHAPPTGPIVLGPPARIELPRPRTTLQWRCGSCGRCGRPRDSACWRCAAARPSEGVLCGDEAACRRACGALWDERAKRPFLGRRCTVLEVRDSGQARLRFDCGEERWFPISLVEGLGGAGYWSERTAEPELRVIAGCVGRRNAWRGVPLPAEAGVDYLARQNVARLCLGAVRAAAHARPQAPAAFLARFFATRGGEWDAAAGTLANWDAAPVDRLLAGTGAPWPKEGRSRALRRGSARPVPSEPRGPGRTPKPAPKFECEEEERAGDEEWLENEDVEGMMERALADLLAARPRPDCACAHLAAYFERVAASRAGVHSERCLPAHAAAP